MTRQSVTRISIDVSPDALEARVLLHPEDTPARVAAATLLDALAKANIAIDETVSQRVRDLAALTARGERVTEPFLIATGRPAAEGRDGEFLWHESLTPKRQHWCSDNAVDHYTFNSVVTVDEGQTIGTLVRCVPGVAGIDVYGRLVPPKRAVKGVTYASAINVTDDDPAVVSVDVSGVVTYEDRHLAISEVFEVPEDVDFSTGHIDSSVDVHVPGVICDRFRVRSKRSVLVDGTVEAACVTAGRDVHAGGGILQRGKGYVRARGQITAKFCDHAVLRAGKDVTIERDLIRCDVRCGGTLSMPNGAIVGGSVFAREGLEAAVLGSGAAASTAACVGTHPSILRKAERMYASSKAKRAVAKRLRQTIVRLEEDMNRLNAAQQVRFAELATKVDMIGDAIKVEEAKRGALLSAAEPAQQPVMLVNSMVHPGARIRIGCREATIENALAGPVRIEERTHLGITAIVAVDPSRNSVKVLRSTQVAEAIPTC